MQEIVQILLVGGRQAPNLLGVQLLQPKVVEMLVSQDEKSKIKDLKAALHPLTKVTETPIVIDAHNYQQCFDACMGLIERHAGKTVQFNLTAGTKIMAFAAYNAARERHLQAFYVNTAKAEIVWLSRNKQPNQPFHLTIKQYLSSYGRQPKRKFDFSKLSFDKPIAIDAANILANAGDDGVELLNLIKTLQGSGARTIPFIELSSNAQQLARQLTQMGCLASSGKGAIIRSNEDWNFFKGDWLEIYVWNKALRLQIFDECALSLRIPADKAEKEIDLACMYQGQMIHCSCKTNRKPFDTAYLDELRAVSDLIGGRFCTRIFVTNISFPNDETRGKFLDQAKQREIVVVTGDKLPDFDIILRKQAERPDYRRV